MEANANTMRIRNVRQSQTSVLLTPTVTKFLTSRQCESINSCKIHKNSTQSTRETVGGTVGRPDGALPVGWWL